MPIFLFKDFELFSQNGFISINHATSMNKCLLAIISLLLAISCTKKEVYDLRIDHTELSMYVTEQVQLKASVAFTGFSSVDMTWESNNPVIASVDETGTVTAHNAGNATITLTCDNNSISCNITVLSEEFALLVSKSHPDGANQTMWIWKDGKFIYNSAADQNVTPYDICVVKKNIYVCGAMYVDSDTTHTLQAAFWKDNSVTILPANNFNADARAIAVNNDTTYVVGNLYPIDNSNSGGPVVWINGTMSALSTISNDIVEDINVFQGRYIACGYSDSNALYWDNGTKNILSGDFAAAKHIEISNNDIYIVGEIINVSGKKNTAIWKNNNLSQILTDKDNYPTATFIFRDKLYIVGVISDDNGLYNTTYLYSDGEIKYYSFDDAIYYPKSISVTSQNICIIFEKTEYTIDGGINNTQVIIMRNDSFEQIIPVGDTDITPVSFYAR